jgi:hypothetical protein
MAEPPPCGGQSIRVDQEAEMSSRTMLTFSLAFAVFFIGPAILDFPFPPYHLMKAGDVFDLLTPLVLIPLYWGLYRGASEKPATDGMMLAFVVLASLWVLGQGMHLAANSIGHQLDNFGDTPGYQLTVFYDERLSHYLWHLGLFGLTGLILIRSWGAAPSSGGSRWALGAAVLIYGLMFFIIVVEGQTPLIGVPFAMLAAVVVVWRERGLPRSRPALVWI